MEVDLDDFWENPGKYGAPTFDEFVKNREHYLKRSEQIFESVQDGGILFKKGLRKIKFWIEGYQCETLEKIQAIAKDMGYQNGDLETRTELIEVVPGTWDAHVTFWSKEQLRKRELQT